MRAIGVALLGLMCAVGAAATPTSSDGLAAAAVSSGASRITVTQMGLDQMRDIALPVLNAALGGNLDLPDIHLSKSVPVFGSCSIDLTSIVVSGFHIPTLDMAFAAPNSISGSVDGLGLHVDMNFKVRKNHWPHLSTSGSITASAGGGDLSLGMSMTADPTGHAHLNVLSTTADFSDFKITFHKSLLSWLYDLIADLLKGDLKKTIDSSIEGAVTKAINTSANKALDKITMNATFGGGRSKADLDYSLVAVNASAATKASGGYMSLDDALAIKDNMTGAACPLVPAPLPPLSPGDPNNMLHILLADSFISCVAWVSYANDAVHLRVDHGLLGILNTSKWGGIAPGLPAKYPNASMVAYVDLLTVPTITSTAGSGTVGAAAAKFNFTVLPQGPGGPEVHTHSVAMGLDLGIDISIANRLNKTSNETVPTLVMNITQLALNMSALDSLVGPLDTAGLNALFKTLTGLLQGLINAFISGGIPIPGAASGLALVNDTVTFGNGYFALSADFEVVPNATAIVGAARVAAPSIAGRGTSLRGLGGGV